MALKDELKKLIITEARREIRSELQSVKSMNNRQKKHIANLRRQIDALEKRVKAIEKRVPEEPEGFEVPGEEVAGWLTGNGVKAARERFAFSRAQMGTLAGVSDQSILNWENRGRKKIEFRSADTLARMKAIVALGKREAQSELERMEGAQG